MNMSEEPFSSTVKTRAHLLNEKHSSDSQCNFMCRTVEGRAALRNFWNHFRRTTQSIELWQCGELFPSPSQDHANKIGHKFIVHLVKPMRLITLLTT